MTALTQFNPSGFGELIEFAKMVSRTQIVPTAYQGKPDDIVAAVIMGADVGLTPMQALQNIAVIRGKATIWGDGLLAICQGHPAFAGIKEWIEEVGTPEATAYCRIRRAVHGEIEETTQSFSVAKAKRANLWGNKGPWSQYPERMLQMRARGFALRDTFSDALKGFLPAEEVSDYNDEPARIQQVEAPPEVKAVLMPPAKPEVIAEEPKPEVMAEETPKRRGAATGAEREVHFEKAAKSFAEYGVSTAQLLAYCGIPNGTKFTNGKRDLLVDAFKKVSAGMVPKGLGPEMATCTAIPDAPVSEMAGVE
jgi:hypothetical protein